MEFYNVKKKERVRIDDSLVEKVSMENVSKNGKLVVRYAFKAVDEDGTKLTKFCSKASYDKFQGS